MRSTRYGGRIVLKPFRVCAIVVALMTVGDGVAAADPMKIPDVNQYVDTMDGWRLNASLTDVTINPVPNMAATAFSREGFVSGRATEVIEGTSSVPVKEGTLILWVQFGCQIDLRAGGYFGSTMTNLLGSSLNIGDIFGAPAVAAGVVPSQSLNPNMQVNLRPGNIYRAPLATKDFASPTKKVHINVRDTQVKVDGCGGPVSVRLVATGRMSTNSSDDWVNAYSDIVQL
jgi:MspA